LYINVNLCILLPGGGLDEGEALIDGVKREMLEETGVEARVGDLLYVQQFTHGEEDYLEFFFNITNSHDYLNIDLANSTHGEAEIEEIDFINPKTVHVLPEFLATENLAEQASGKSTKVISRL
jgi:ADP-ribose pyrophosphatase YjhB (NUDIX family)